MLDGPVINDSNVNCGRSAGNENSTCKPAELLLFCLVLLAASALSFAVAASGVVRMLIKLAFAQLLKRFLPGLF